MSKKSYDKDDLGTRMKSYEVSSTRRAFKGQPLVVRLDGNNFHTFTKGLERPFDRNLSQLMVRTTEALVERFHCTVAYTQSDEITLVFVSRPEDKAELLFDGRLTKIETLTASYATAFFNKHLGEFLPQKAHLMPIFDSRADVAPNLQEAYHNLLWRQNDATKNAISMAAQSVYKQSELQGKHGGELQEMLFQKGINFNDYPTFFKRGSFVKRGKIQEYLTEEELSRIPEKHRPTGPVTRGCISVVDFWLSKMDNPIEELFK